MDEFGKELESEEKKLKGTEEQADYYHKKFYERFADGIFDYLSGGKIPFSVSTDLKILFECREKKHKGLGDELTEIHSVSPLSEISGTGDSDEKYKYKRLYKTYKRELQVYKKRNGIKYSRKEQVYFYENIIEANQSKINDDDKFVCPSCGKICGLKQLEQDCPECGSAAFITDLFPKVINCFNVRNISVTMSGIIKKLTICGLIGFATGIPAGAFMMISHMPAYLTQNIIFQIISDVFIMPFKGLAAGLVGAVFWIIGQLIYFGVKKSPVIERMNSVKKSINSFMADKDASFSFEHFESKVVFLTQLMIYSNDRKNLPICGFEYNVRQYDIIDSVYSGFIELKKIKSENDICIIELEIIMKDTYDYGNKFFCRDDTFIIKLQKNISKPTNLDFEIKKVQCHECGEYFDGWTNKACPSCGSEYKLENDDWIVKEFKLK